MEFECSFEGPVRDVQAWADSQDAARGSSAVGAAVKGLLVFAGRDPNAVCVAEVKLDEVGASVSVRLVGVAAATVGFPQSQTTDVHAAAIDAAQAGVEAPVVDEAVVVPDAPVESSDVPADGAVA